jgi:hypothetical protein
MTIIPSILNAVAWPLVVVVALFVFRRSIPGLAKLAGERVQKVSFAGIGVEFAAMRNITPATLDVELRQMSGAPPIQSGSGSVYQVYHDLLMSGSRGYVIVELGSDDAPQWLSSRLYLLAYLITLVEQSICMVFVETVGGFRRRFVGVASPDDVRWTLTRRYVWLEPAMAGAYATFSRGAYQPVDQNTGQTNPPTGPLIDRATGRLAEYQASQLMFAFLTNVQTTTLPPNAPNNQADDWTRLENGIVEYAVRVEPAGWSGGFAQR